MSWRFRLLPFVVFISACSAKMPDIYRLDIQQGNVLDAPMLARLSPGMEKRQVRFILGTPMIIDTFNQGRWDYVYTYSQGGTEIEQRQVTLFFEDDRLVRVEGDVHSDGAAGESPSRGSLVIVPEKRTTPGFFSTFKQVLDLFGAKRKSHDRDADASAPED